MRRQTGALADFDVDGDLDLVSAQRSAINRMFRNDGGTFTDVSADAGLDDPRRTVGACWFDMDQDGDLDLSLAEDSPDDGRHTLVRNDLPQPLAGRSLQVQVLDREGRATRAGRIQKRLADIDPAAFAGTVLVVTAD